MSPIVRWTNVVASREDKQGEIKLTDFNDIPIRSGMTLSVTRHNETKVLIDLREE